MRIGILSAVRCDIRGCSGKARNGTRTEDGELVSLCDRHAPAVLGTYQLVASEHRATIEWARCIVAIQRGRKGPRDRLAWALIDIDEAMRAMAGDR